MLVINDSNSFWSVAGSFFPPTAPIIMFVVYLIVIVPVGLWFKVTKRDLMRRQLDPGAKTYWEDYPGSDDPASYIQQY